MEQKGKCGEWQGDRSGRDSAGVRAGGVETRPQDVIYTETKLSFTVIVCALPPPMQFIISTGKRWSAACALIRIITDLNAPPHHCFTVSRRSAVSTPAPSSASSSSPLQTTLQSTRSTTCAGACTASTPLPGIHTFSPRVFTPPTRLVGNSSAPCVHEGLIDPP